MPFVARYYPHLVKPLGGKLLPETDLDIRAAYLFRETSGAARDEVGANHTTVTTAPSRVMTPRGIAARFTGSETFNCGSPADLNLANVPRWTICAEVSVSSWPADSVFQSIIQRPYDSGSTTAGFNIFLYNSAGVIELKHDTYSAALGAVGAKWNVTGWNLNQVYVLVCVFDGNAWRIYFDGRQVASFSTTQNAQNNALPVYIGSNGSSHWWKGDIHALYVAHKAWSADEVRRVSEAPYTVFQPRRADLWWATASATTYYQALSANSTVSAAVTKRIAVTKSATSTATATIAKRINKIVSTTGTVTASMLKSLRVTLSATSTGTATLAALRVVMLTLSATSTATASMIKRIAKTASASSTATASMTKRLSIQIAATSTATAQALKTLAKTLAATSTASATLATLRVVLLTLTATSNAVASIGKRLSKTVTATSTATASMTKRISISLTAAAVATASLTKRLSLTLMATSAAVATMARNLTQAGLVVVANAARTIVGIARRRLFTGEKRDRDHEF